MSFDFKHNVNSFEEPSPRDGWSNSEMQMLLVVSIGSE